MPINEMQMFWIETYLGCLHIPSGESGKHGVQRRASRKSERNKMLLCLAMLPDAYIGSSPYPKRKDVFAKGRSLSEQIEVQTTSVCFTQNKGV